MKILLIDNGTKHLGKLKELLAGNEIETVPLFRKYPPSDGYDLIILSGGSQIALVSAPEIFKEEITLIKNSIKPIIGICEGCEIIAYTFGSTLELSETKAKGIKKIQLINNTFFDFDSPIEVYEAHHFAITKLGNELIGIAKSYTGWEIIKHKDKPIYGFQFHPEMLVDKTEGDEIFKSVFDKIKK